MSNSSGLNDYLHFLTFGDTISFRAEFFLPAPLVGDSAFSVTPLADGVTITNALIPEPSTGLLLASALALLAAGSAHRLRRRTEN
jgi:hypothetical protein